MDDSKNGEKGEVCEQTFLHGKAACTNKKCKKMHKLDFVKIRSGICYKEFEETALVKEASVGSHIRYQETSKLIQSSLDMFVRRDKGKRKITKTNTAKTEQ